MRTPPSVVPIGTTAGRPSEGSHCKPVDLPIGLLVVRGAILSVNIKGLEHRLPEYGSELGSVIR